MSAIDRKESQGNGVTNPDRRREAANLLSGRKSPVVPQLIAASEYPSDPQDAAVQPVLHHAEALLAEWARAA
jgi:hypothetical protein